MRMLNARLSMRPRAGKALLLALALVMAVPTIAFGSHFRYGNNSWRPGAGANEIQFQVEVWRRSAFSGTGSDGMPVPDDVVFSNNLTYGDGNTDGVELLVTSIDTTDDWLFGTARPSRVRVRGHCPLRTSGLDLDMALCGVC